MDPSVVNDGTKGLPTKTCWGWVLGHININNKYIETAVDCKRAQSLQAPHDNSSLPQPAAEYGADSHPMSFVASLSSSCHEYKN